MLTKADVQAAQAYYAEHFEVECFECSIAPYEVTHMADESTPCSGKRYPLRRKCPCLTPNAPKGFCGYCRDFGASHGWYPHHKNIRNWAGTPDLRFCQCHGLKYLPVTDSDAILEAVREKGGEHALTYQPRGDFVRVYLADGRKGIVGDENGLRGSAAVSVALARALGWKGYAGMSTRRAWGS